MENAKQFFDELKKKGMQQVEQAMYVQRSHGLLHRRDSKRLTHCNVLTDGCNHTSEDWDYQDFSPDKRRALLEEQITNDVADDLSPEADAIHHIQVSRQQINWSGLSPDDELAEYVASRCVVLRGVPTNVRCRPLANASLSRMDGGSTALATTRTQSRPPRRATKARW